MLADDSDPTRVRAGTPGSAAFLLVAFGPRDDTYR